MRARCVRTFGFVCSPSKRKQSSLKYTTLRDRQRERKHAAHDMDDKHSMLLIDRPREKYLWETNPETAEKIKVKVKRNSHEETNLPFIAGDLTRYTVRLPGLTAARDWKWPDSLIDRHILEKLEETEVVNWCRSLNPLQPLTVPGDGNCLLHAVSVAMWGIPDSTLLLRRLLYIALVEDSDSGQIQYRWKAEKGWLNLQVPSGGLTLNSMEWSSEWTLVKRMAEDKPNPRQANMLGFESLEEIHIFVLANILRRPIIVLAEPIIRSVWGSTVAPNNCGGIYLPLLLPPGDCVKTPIVLGFESNHFAPFVGGVQDNRRVTATTRDAVPVVTNKLEPMHIHFLSSQEEQQATGLLTNYLNLVEVKSGEQHILSASLQYHQIDSALDLMTGFCRKHSPPPARPPVHTASPKHVAQRHCTTTGCKYFGSPEAGDRCSQCFMRYTLQDAVHNHPMSSHRVELPLPTHHNHPTSSRVELPLPTHHNRPTSSHRVELPATHHSTWSAPIDGSTALLYDRRTCLQNGCLLEGRSDYNGYCRSCFMKCQTPALTHPYTTDDIRTCVGPDCCHLVDDDNSLCRRCYRTLALHNTVQRQSASGGMRRSQSIRVKWQPCRPPTTALGSTHPKYTRIHASPRQPSAPPSVRARLCRGDNCDYFGDSNLDGYCSHCFPPYTPPDGATGGYRRDYLQPASASEAPVGFIPR